MWSYGSIVFLKDDYLVDVDAELNIEAAVLVLFAAQASIRVRDH